MPGEAVAHAVSYATSCSVQRDGRHCRSAKWYAGCKQHLHVRLRSMCVCCVGIYVYLPHAQREHLRRGRDLLQRCLQSEHCCGSWLFEPTNTDYQANEQRATYAGCGCKKLQYRHFHSSIFGFKVCVPATKLALLGHCGCQPCHLSALGMEALCRQLHATRTSFPTIATSTPLRHWHPCPQALLTDVKNCGTW